MFLVLVVLAELTSTWGHNGLHTGARYPPHTLKDTLALASSSTTRVGVIQRGMLTFPPCRCRLNAVLPDGASPRKVVAALLHVLFANRLDKQLDDFGQGGAVVVFGYHKVSQIGVVPYAGRVNLSLA